MRKVMLLTLLAAFGVGVALAGVVIEEKNPRTVSITLTADQARALQAKPGQTVAITLTPAQVNLIRQSFPKFAGTTLLLSTDNLRTNNAVVLTGTADATTLTPQPNR